MKEYQPLKISGLKGEKVKQIECGDYHSGFLTESGSVFMTGDNTKA